MITLHQGDAVTWLRSLPSRSVDLVDIDVAYESLEKHRAKGTTTRLTGSWFEIFRNERFPELFRECFRVLRDDRHMYFWCDQETMFVAKPIAEAAGFKFWRPLVWDKKAIGMGYHYRCRHEFILFLEKGSRRVNDLSIPDVLESKRIVGSLCDSCDRGGTWDSRVSTPRAMPSCTGREGRSLSSTDLSGSSTTARSRKGTRSTTSTRTSSTIESRTCSALTSSPTSASTPAAICETESGGSPAFDAGSSSQLLSSTGILLPTAGGQSSDDAALATFESPSSASRPDELSACPRCGRRRRRTYATEKPVDVHRTLIEQSTRPGELVVDAFMGSGSAGVAAAECGRDFAGNDLSPDSIALALSRLPGAVVVPDAPAYLEPGQLGLFGGAA